MRLTRPHRAAASLGLLLLLGGVAQAALQLPAAPEGRVSDFAGVLSPERRAALEEQLRRYEGAEGAGGAQIVVVALPPLGDEPIEDVAIHLAERWKIGSKADNGVLLVLAPRERRVRIEVGYGAEGLLPDATASRIIREIMAPRLRAGDIYGGLAAGAAGVHQALTGKPVTGEDPQLQRLAPAPRKQVGNGGGRLGGGLVLLLIFLVVVFSGRRGGGFLAGMLLGSLFGGRGGGGGGGGGFRGGGGSFGGGGASGDY